MYVSSARGFRQHFKNSSHIDTIKWVFFFLFSIFTPLRDINREKKN